MFRERNQNIQVVFAQNIVKGFRVCQNSRIDGDREIGRVQYERMADCCLSIEVMSITTTLRRSMRAQCHYVFCRRPFAFALTWP